MVDVKSCNFDATNIPYCEDEVVLHSRGADASMMVQVCETESKGNAVYAMQDLPAHCYLPYYGVICDARDRPKVDDKCMAFGTKYIIDSSAYHGIAANINHSCQPNCTFSLYWYAI